MKETILRKFELKWCQDENTGLLKPLCHIDDVMELLDLQKKRAVRIVERTAKDLDGKMMDTEAVEIIHKMRKSIKKI